MQIELKLNAVSTAHESDIITTNKITILSHAKTRFFELVGLDDIHNATKIQCLMLNKGYDDSERELRVQLLVPLFETISFLKRQFLIDFDQKWYVSFTGAELISLQGESGSDEIQHIKDVFRYDKSGGNPSNAQDGHSKVIMSPVTIPKLLTEPSNMQINKDEVNDSNHEKPID